MATIEERLAALEAKFISEIPWFQKHWYAVAAVTFVVGILLEKIAKL